MYPSVIIGMENRIRLESMSSQYRNRSAADLTCISSIFDVDRRSIVRSAVLDSKLVLHNNAFKVSGAFLEQRKALAFLPLKR